MILVLLGNTQGDVVSNMVDAGSKIVEGTVTPAKGLTLQFWVFGGPPEPDRGTNPRASTTVPAAG